MSVPLILKKRSVHLLLSLIVLFLTYPFTELVEEPWGSRLTALVTTWVLLTAVWWSADSRLHRVWGVALVAPAILAFWFQHALGHFSSLAWTLFLFYVVGRLLGRVLSPHTLFEDRVVTAMAVYLLAAMTYAYLHRLVWKVDPEAYHFPGGAPAAAEIMVDMLYFSMVSILTLGFGDIVPVSPFARMLTVMEAFTGAFFIAILVSRLVSMGHATVPAADEVPGHEGGDEPPENQGA